MNAYKEIPPVGEGIKSKREIFKLLFGDDPVGNELSLLDSFLGILQLMQDHFDDKQIEEVFVDFIEFKLYGKEGQALDATNSEGDRSAKIPAISAFINKFPFLKKYDRKLKDLQDEYYRTYKIRSESLRAWGNLLHA